MLKTPLQSRTPVVVCYVRLPRVGLKWYILLVRTAVLESESSLNNGASSFLLTLLEQALLQSISLRWCRRQESWRLGTFSWIPWRGGVAKGHPRSAAGTAGGCDSAAWQGSADAGRHIPSVSATILCQWQIHVAASHEGVAVAVSWDGQRGTTLWLTLPLLFSFSPGSEVLFGLVFREQDFCSVGTRSLVEAFSPPLYFPCSAPCEGEQ